MSQESIKVECQECGKKFHIHTMSSLPECPKCGGSDIDIAWESTNREADGTYL